MAIVAGRETLDDVKPKYLSIIEIGTSPEAAQPGVVAWIDEEVARVRAKAQPEDEVSGTFGKRNVKVAGGIARGTHSYAAAP
jgi:hypothetical protein